jgi:hypothetical protein
MALNAPILAATPRVPRQASGPRGHFLLGSILDFKRDILQAMAEGQLGNDNPLRLVLGDGLLTSSDPSPA